ncbi:aldo/keto reductase family protein [Aquiluna sp. KACHI24]|uniref:aldo/keto reductase family protein n=1 Tax=Aquiluna sp. KACHI24 TaxID=2968831 RepID=UPI0021FE654B|nr:aldo/keto reductase family protein [Aquiluna sp. KACHI24]BDQ00197.1 aldo/keto reductase [Aquiluna sp. KACHI24]
MKHRYLGNSGLKVSELIYGNWLTHASQVAEEQAIATVNAALEGGITTFDTADAYANQAAEVVLGKALKGQRREGIEILTKVYWPVAAKGPNDCGLSRKHIFESINGSLQRLQTDYVDLYQAHRFDYETPLEETMQAFADLVRMGKVLYVGVSEWNAEQIRAGQKLASELGFKLISNQPQYSMLWRVIEAEVIPTSLELGLGQIVWSPMAQGVLTGKYLPGQPAPEGSRAADPAMSSIVEKFMGEATLTAVQNLRPLADGLGLTTAQFALAWVLQNKAVSAAIVGASRPEQMKDNLGASGVEIPADVMAKVDEVLDGLYMTDPSLTKSPSERPC